MRKWYTQFSQARNIHSLQCNISYLRHIMYYWSICGRQTNKNILSKWYNVGHEKKMNFLGLFFCKPSLKAHLSLKSSKEIILICLQKYTNGMYKEHTLSVFRYCVSIKYRFRCKVSFFRTLCVSACKFRSEKLQKLESKHKFARLYGLYGLDGKYGLHMPKE